MGREDKNTLVSYGIWYCVTEREISEYTYRKQLESVGMRRGGWWRWKIVGLESRHEPDVDAEKGWRVVSVDRDATILCRGENFMAGVGGRMGQEGGYMERRGSIIQPQRGGRILVDVTYHWSSAEVHALYGAGARTASDSGSSMR